MKKIPPKQKKPHLIPSELIKGKCFAEIISCVSEKSELSNRDRYIYGYALLQTQQNLAALVSLWPLAAKGEAKLQEDCAVIAAHVFAEAESLATIHLADDAIYTLFMAAKQLMPQSVACYTLQQRLGNTLWQQGQFEKLERILKATKDEFSGILVENLSKLDFFQPERKLLGNIPAFVGHVLTGGACLIARDATYHGDIAKALHALASELKYLYYQLKTKNKPLAWERMLFENFVDHEANILTHVLQLVVKSNSVPFDIIPTPSYLMYYDATTKRVSDKFLPWLAAESKELLAAYDADTYNAVLLALGGEKTPQSNKILKSASKNKFDPYLLLALMLRSVTMPKTSFGVVVQLSDFANLKPTTNIFKEIVAQTIKSLISTQSHKQLPVEFWQMLIEFYPILKDADFHNMLVTQLVENLKNKVALQLNLNVTALRNIAQQIDASDFAKQAEALCIRQHACEEFLLDLDDEKKSKKLIKKIADEPALRAHLTLLADCCFLLPEEISLQFFLHVEAIARSNKLNKFIALKEYFSHELECGCPACEARLCQKIPALAKELNLSIASIPNIPCPVKTQSAAIPKAPILAQADPFQILGVSLTDSKQVILQKVMQLIQQSPGKMAVYRQAQSELFHPAQRFLQHYLRYLSYKSSNSAANVKLNLPLTHSSLQAIPLRHEFLDEN